MITSFSYRSEPGIGETPLMALQAGVEGHRIARTPVATAGVPPFIAYELCRFVSCNLIMMESNALRLALP